MPNRTFEITRKQIDHIDGKPLREIDISFAMVRVLAKVYGYVDITDDAKKVQLLVPTLGYWHSDITHDITVQSLQELRDGKIKTLPFTLNLHEYFS